MKSRNKLSFLALLLSFMISPAFVAAPPEKKVTTKALYSYFNQKTGELVLKGNAVVEREDIQLSADEIFYNNDKKEAYATGNVKLNHVDFILESGQLRLYLKGNRYLEQMMEKDMVMIAQKHPKLTEKMKENGQYSQITAVEIKFYKGSEKIEAFENVKMVQMMHDGLKSKEETVVLGDFMEYKSSDRLARVKGNVKLDSKDLGARGERLIYYQGQSKFYMIGDAHVFQYDAQGKVKDTISGNKILHFLKEKRTILMGNIEGSLEMED
jgi:lipopolysaccharide assembly outer membrane protein LptD (OstA)